MSEQYILDAKTYLPDFFYDSAVMLEIINCLNVLISKKQPTFENIESAYLDTLYKMRDYTKLSYEAKLDIVKELGFDYLLDILTLTSDQLTSLLIFFNLIYILKGKEEGLKICLDTMGMVYEYIPWDRITDQYPTERQKFTAILNIVGNDYAHPNIFRKIKNFIRSYMLPWVEITVALNIDAPNTYIYPSGGLLTKLKTTTIFSVIRDAVDVAIYDVDSYDIRNYGVFIDTLEPPKQEVKYTLTIVPKPIDAKVTINGIETTSLEVIQGDVITYTVKQDDNVYIPKEGHIVLTKDKTLNVELILR